MAKYKCSVCGYIYDEEKEGQQLLDSKCPVCGMTMVLMEENDSEAAAFYCSGSRCSSGGAGL